MFCGSAARVRTQESGDDASGFVLAIPPKADISQWESACPLSATFGHTNGQAEADIRAVTRLTICGSRRALDRFTR
jgi:hypothetical protein